MTTISLKGSALGFKQANSLMNHNNIFNSSIIINIIINGKNHSRRWTDETDDYTSYPTAETPGDYPYTIPAYYPFGFQDTTEPPRNFPDLDDPRFWMPVQTAPPDEEPDNGFLKFNDRRVRPHVSFGDDTTTFAP